jgi:hypothetical protein
MDVVSNSGMSFRVESLKVEGYTTFGRTATEVQSFVYCGRVMLEVQCVIRKFYYEWDKKVNRLL